VIPKGTFAGRNIGFLQWKGYTEPADLPEARRRPPVIQPRVATTGCRGACRCLLEFEGAYYEPLSLGDGSHFLALKTGKFPKSTRLAPERYVSRTYGGLEWSRSPADDSGREMRVPLIPYRGTSSASPISRSPTSSRTASCPMP